MGLQPLQAAMWCPVRAAYVRPRFEPLRGFSGHHYSFRCPGLADFARSRQGVQRIGPPEICRLPDAPAGAAGLNWLSSFSRYTAHSMESACWRSETVNAVHLNSILPIRPASAPISPDFRAGAAQKWAKCPKFSPVFRIPEKWHTESACSSRKTAALGKQHACAWPRQSLVLALAPPGLNARHGLACSGGGRSPSASLGCAGEGDRRSNSGPLRDPLD